MQRSRCVLALFGIPGNLPDPLTCFQWREAIETLIAIDNPEFDPKAVRAECLKASVQLMDMLDWIDAVTEDLEPEPDEPSLGSNEAVLDQTRWSRGNTEETEIDNEPDPSLGSLEQVDQRWWSIGNDNDREGGAEQ